MDTRNAGGALEVVVKKYSRLIRSVVGRVAGPLSSSVADDIEQNVLISLWRAMPGEQMPSHPFVLHPGQLRERRDKSLVPALLEVRPRATLDACKRRFARAPRNP